MAMSAAQRKRAQRQREKERAAAAAITGRRQIAFCVSDYTYNLIEKACAARRPGKEPYAVDEYFELLAIEDARRLKNQLLELRVHRCKLCGDPLPGEAGGCCRRGEFACGQNDALKKLKLKTM